LIVRSIWDSADDFDDDRLPPDCCFLFKNLKVCFPRNDTAKWYLRELVRCTSLPKLAAYISFVGVVAWKMDEEQIRLFRDIVEVRLTPFLVDDDRSFRHWVVSLMGMDKLYKIHHFSCLTSSSFNMKCAKLLQWYELGPPEDSLCYLIRALKMANRINLGVVTEEIFVFPFLETWLKSRLYARELVLNGYDVSRALEAGELCVNSFNHLKLLLETYPDSRLTYPSKFAVRDNWKDWFLLPKEFDAINRYDGAIRAIEFVINISEDHIVDCDSIRAGMIYFCCIKLSSLIRKITSKFDPVLVEGWLSGVDGIRSSVLELKLYRDMVADLDESLFEICREGDIPCLSFFGAINDVMDHVFLGVPLEKRFGNSFLDSPVHRCKARLSLNLNWTAERPIVTSKG
jgi:tetratricopeptide (TPR) repeat protein